MTLNILAHDSTYSRFHYSATTRSRPNSPFYILLTAGQRPRPGHREAIAEYLVPKKPNGTQIGEAGAGKS